MDGEKRESEHGGFEQGPIRPPSEATSLLLRVTRNCHWNRCAFCPVYKGARFSRRGVEEILGDIRAMGRGLERIQAESARRGYGGAFPHEFLAELFHDPSTGLHTRSLLIWLSGGGRTAFLQDADSMVVKPKDLGKILRTLRETFPSLERVTCYARSQTLARRSTEDFRFLRAAGLDRVHVGLESGSDTVLALMRKGCTAEEHIQGGRRVMEAGLELSEYVMPGLGGPSLSREHALETARVLSAIDPHFIRLRTLAVPDGTPLAESMAAGEFDWLWDVEIVAEIRLLVESLEGVHSRVASDHILNLLMEVEGKLPEERAAVLSLLDRFLSLDPDEQETYIVGRRSGIFRCLDDLSDPAGCRWAEQQRDRLREKGEVREVVRSLARRFI